MIIDIPTVEGGEFIDGGPNKLGTIVKASFLNSLMKSSTATTKEIETILTAAGIAPDSREHDQLLKAIKKMIAAEKISVTNVLGEDTSLAASQALVNSVNKKAVSAGETADAAGILATAAKKRAERLPLPIQNKVPVGKDDEEYKLLTMDEFKALLNIKAGLPIGHIYWGLAQDEGSLSLGGGEISRTEFAELFEWAKKKNLIVSEADWQTHVGGNWGQCAYFSGGNGSTTFRVPLITQYIKGGGIGYQHPGLPNIWGNFWNSWGMVTGSDGAFSTGGSSATLGGQVGGITANSVGFNASRINGIFGASNTVDTIAVKGIWQIKAR